MALVSLSKKLIFCPSAGTASTSICQFLLQHTDSQWIPSEAFMWDGRLFDYKHSGLEVLLKFDLLDRDFVRNAWSFSMVRHPFSWYVSEFLRCKLWFSLLADESSWVHHDPKTRSRIIAAQSDFLPFCRLVMQQSRPTELDPDRNSWELFQWTATDCSAVFRYEDMFSIQAEIVRRLGLSPECRFPYINKTPVSTLLHDNIDLFATGAADLIAHTHAPTFELYDYPTELSTAAHAQPIIWVPDTLPADFSAVRYLNLNPDLQQAGVNPAQHYLAYGQFELRKYK
jgi:hypothetical protein